MPKAERVIGGGADGESGAGRGRASEICTQAAAIDHARFIVEQRALGYAFDEIRPILHARWGSADKVPLEEVEVREAKIKAAKTKGREEPS